MSFPYGEGNLSCTAWVLSPRAFDLQTAYMDARSELPEWFTCSGERGGEGMHLAVPFAFTGMPVGMAALFILPTVGALVNHTFEA